MITNLPTLGAGLSYRPRWRNDILNGDRSVACLEIIAEQFLNVPPDRMADLDRLAEKYPIIPHGIGLSFGTDAPLDKEHLDAVARIVERVKAPWFTEHMAFTHAH